MVDLEGIQSLLVLIGSEQSQARRVATIVSKVGWRVVCASDHREALAILEGLQGTAASAAILDGWPAGQDGATALSELRRHHPDLPVVLLTSSSDVCHAVEAMRAGATDYLVRPFPPDRLLGALRMAISGLQSPGQLQPLSEKFDFPHNFEAMVGTDAKFRATLARAALAARGHGHVLVEGEGGTGKTMLLRALHAASLRSKRPFKIVNMRGYTGGALTSVLFGHEKGAFPGAFDKQVGALQYCQGGTLLLQEVNRMPARVQQQLAASIHEARVRPLGAQYSFLSDLRLLATSNQPLSELVEAGSFDSSLYEALAATRLELPALRARSRDIPALARSFLSLIRDHSNARDLTINEAAYDLLRSYEWPGNIRQLQSVILRAFATCEGDALTPDHLPALVELATSASPLHLKPRHIPEQVGVEMFEADGNLRPLEQIEADVIRLALGHYHGRMTEVARRLGIGRSTLYRKLHDLGMATLPERGNAQPTGAA